MIVRGLDKNEVRAFLADGRGQALSALFEAAPGAELEAPVVDSFARRRAFLGAPTPPVDWEEVTAAAYLWHDRRIGEAAILREVGAFVELLRAVSRAANNPAPRAPRSSDA